jgi:hypothetical protein
MNGKIKTLVELMSRNLDVKNLNTSDCLTIIEKIEARLILMLSLCKEQSVIHRKDASFSKNKNTKKPLDIEHLKRAIVILDDILISLLSNPTKVLPSVVRIPFKELLTDINEIKHKTEINPLLRRIYLSATLKLKNKDEIDTPKLPAKIKYEYRKKLSFHYAVYCEILAIETLFFQDPSVFNIEKDWLVENENFVILLIAFAYLTDQHRKYLRGLLFISSKTKTKLPLKKIIEIISE